MRFSPLPIFAKLILSIFLILAFLAPLPFVILMPGSAQNIFDSIIVIKNEKTYPPNGRIDLMSIRVTNPDSYLFGPQILYSWLKGDDVVFPHSAIYKPGTTTKKEDATAKADMNLSQNLAIKSAMVYLLSHPELTGGGAISAKNISFKVKDTGGPSGGMVFAIGLIELLTKEDLLKGRHIAGTGTITTSGIVGQVGGIAEKITAAKKAGVKLFIAPAENCEDIEIIPQGIQVIAVRTLSQAIVALRTSSGSNSMVEKLQGCASVGT